MPYPEAVLSPIDLDRGCASPIVASLDDVREPKWDLTAGCFLLLMFGLIPLYVLAMAGLALALSLVTGAVR
jgi:hypothetical protein